MSESWRWVAGTDERYEVSDLGRVRSWIAEGNTRGRRRDEPYILSSYLDKNGYASVGIRRYGKKKRWFIAPMVLEAFVGPRPSGLQAAHNNGKSSDNRLVNLRWATPLENTRDKIEHGTSNAVLTDEAVEAARLDWAARRLTTGALAARYSVSPGVMHAALLGKTHKAAGGPLAQRRMPVYSNTRDIGQKAKLTEAQVLSIRQRYAAGEAKQSELATEFGVGRDMISRIVRGLSYRSVGGPLATTNGTRPWSARGATSAPSSTAA